MEVANQQFFDERIKPWLVVDVVSGCWLWQRSTNNRGYGTVRGIGGKPEMVHRLVYECLKGPIPDGLTLDHNRSCVGRNCCNPDHLTPKSLHQNILSGGNARKTVCKWGHPLAGDNLYVNAKGQRSCITCRKTAFKKSQDNKKKREAS